MKYKIFIFLFLLFSLSTGIVQALSCGDIITSDTTLTENLNGNGNCLTIGADNILVDCNSFAITGSNIGHGILIFGYNHITVKNCQISNFEIGISVWHSNNNNIENNSVFQNTETGIKVVDSSNNQITDNLGYNNLLGIWLAITSNNNIIQNGNYSNNYASGIKLSDDSRNNIIENNSAINNSLIGIWLTNASYNNISYNQFDYNAWAGMQINSSSSYNNILNNIVNSNTLGILLFHAQNNLARENTATNNTLAGVYVVASSRNIVESNNISLNGGTGIKMGEPESEGSYDNLVINNVINNNRLGIWARNCGSNNISNNLITQNNFSGILLADQSPNNSLYNNLIDKNGWGVFFLDSSFNNTLAKNIIDNNDNIGLFLGSSDYNNITNNTISNNNDGIQIYNSSSNSILDNEISSNIDNGIFTYLASNQNLISGNSFISNYYGVRLSSINNNLTRNNITSNNVGVIIALYNYIGIYNNIYGNTNYDFYNNRTLGITVKYEWWGTTNSAQIDPKIYDNEEGKGAVYFAPVLTRPYSNADWDNDGIVNENDECLYTEPLQQVDSKGCMVDASSVVTTSGGTVANEAGTIIMDISSGAVGQNTTVTINAITNATPYSYAVKENSQIQGYVYDFNSSQNFTTNITVNFTYNDPGSLTEAEEYAMFDVYYYNGTNWIPQNAAQDIVSNILSIETDHFSVFAVIQRNNPIGINWLPPISLANFTIQTGSTLPIKFDVRDDGTFIIDKNIKVIVRNSSCIVRVYTYGEGTDNLRIDSTGYYIANFNTKDIPQGTYKIEIVMGDYTKSIVIEILKLSGETKGKAIGKNN